MRIGRIDFIIAYLTLFGGTTKEASKAYLKLSNHELKRIMREYRTICETA